MKISVAIPAFNEEKYLGECLKSVLKYKTKNVVEILVIDNASTDQTATVALSFPEVRVVFEPKKGLTMARQRALEESCGDLLAFLDADTRISQDWFKTIEQEFAQNPKLVCLSGPYKYFDLVRNIDQISEKIWIFFALEISKLTGKVVFGGNFVARKAMLQKVGGFNEHIAFYGEDTDIARRLAKTGEVKFIKTFFVLTSARRFEGQGLFKTAFLYGMNFFWILFFKKPFSKNYIDIR